MAGGQIQDSSPGDLLGPVMTSSMLCLKFRFNLIDMERSLLEDFAIKTRHAHGREGASSRYWERKVGNTAEIL